MLSFQVSFVCWGQESIQEVEGSEDHVVRNGIFSLIDTLRHNETMQRMTSRQYLGFQNVSTFRVFTPKNSTFNCYNYKIKVKSNSVGNRSVRKQRIRAGSDKAM